MEKCEVFNKEHVYRLEKLDDKSIELDKSIQEIKLKVSKIDESVKSAHIRLDNVGEHTLAIYKLTAAVERIAEQLLDLTQENKEHRKEVNDRLDKQDIEITNLKSIPGQEAYEREKQIKNYILIAIVGAVLGAIFMKLGVKL